MHPKTLTRFLGRFAITTAIRLRLNTFLCQARLPKGGKLDFDAASGLYGHQLP